MNILIIILLCFSLLGMLDAFLKGKLGLAKAFEEGLAAMGNLCLSMTGIYCGAVWLAKEHGQWLLHLHNPFVDPALVAGAILAPDLGGYPLALHLAKTTELGYFVGILVSSTLGCLISFVLPISLGFLKGEDKTLFVEGTMGGIITLPAGLLVGGLILGMPIGTCFKQLLPILLLCVVLLLGLRLAPGVCTKLLHGIGILIQVIGFALFAILGFGLFFPEKAVFDIALVGEAVIIVVKITIIVCGSMVLNQLLLRHCSKVLDKCANRLGINKEAVMGLFISFVTSISMLPLYKSMDSKGKKINAAFAVGCAFCLGGQLAYVAAVAPGRVVLAYLACKLTSGTFLLSYYQGRSFCLTKKKNGEKGNS